MTAQGGEEGTSVENNLSLDQLKKGDMLYHYTKCYAASNILRSGVLYATKSSFLNDTNEMEYILHVAGEVIGDLRNEAWQELLMDQVIGAVDEFRRHDIFVLSFSEDADSITLWSEFGEETGYNLGFDGEQLISGIQNSHKIYWHGRVIYNHDSQYSLIETLLKDTVPAQIGKPLESILEEEIRQSGTEAFRQFRKSLLATLNIYAIFYKQPEFAPEKEYRLGFLNPDRRRIRYRSQEGFLLPYIEIRVIPADGREKALLPLKSITVAPKNHVDLARKGMIQYTESLGYQIPVTLSALKLRY